MSILDGIDREDRHALLGCLFVVVVYLAIGVVVLFTTMGTPGDNVSSFAVGLMSILVIVFWPVFLGVHLIAWFGSVLRHLL